MKKVYILDAVNFLFRSYYAIGPITNPKGESTNALFGFIRTVFKLIKDLSCSHLVAVFDGPENTKSRKELYSDYKIHRAKMPEDLFPQLEWALEFCQIAGIPYLSVPGVEADDVMGSIAKWAEERKINAYLCSSDKDLCQLVSDHVQVINPSKNNLVIDREKVKELFGVFPEQMIDYLAIMGDASDNIPGIEGFGPKTASSLLSEFGTLDYILAHPEVVSGKKQETLKASKDVALLSKQLATIHIGIDFPKEDTFFALKEPDLEKVKAFYQEMHFLTLLKELNIPEKKVEELDLNFGVDPNKVTYTIINDADALKKLVKQLQTKRELCVDTETTSLNVRQAKIVGIGISDEPGVAWYIPFNGNISKEDLHAELKPLFQSPEIAWFGHNLKYDLHVLFQAGLPLKVIGFDTMIASHLLAPQKQRHNLDSLSLELFEKVKIPISDLIGKGAKQISMDQVPLEKVATYCCEDVDYTYRLKRRFEKPLVQEGVQKLLDEVEMPLMRVLFEMEDKGIFADRKELRLQEIDLSVKIETLSQWIFEFAKETFNLNSPKQLGEVLFERLGLRPAKRTATGYSTSADVLEELTETSPIIPKIIEYRALEKLRSTYLVSLPEEIDPKTGRIHCTFNQTGTATGRLACSDPNLQNIPVRSEEGRKIRTAFKPEKEGWSYLAADYSQIELRLLAHFSEDPTLLHAFQTGADIHTYTASLVYGIPITEVNPHMRHTAKAVNFGILYGQQAFGLSKEIGISFSEANTFIATYFNRYNKVKEYLEECKKRARQKGYSETLFGRKRPIPEIDSKNSFLRQAAERLAVNTPLQGTAADLIKMAMINIDDLLKKTKAQGYMVLQIHDELIFELPDEEIPRLSQLVKEQMESVVKLKVPLVVDISIGKNWGEC